MLPENKRFADYVGLTAWHKAGYFGQGVIVGSGENFSSGSGGHVLDTYNCFKEFAPQAEVIYVPMNQTETENKFITEGIPLIQENKLLGMWASLILDYDVTAINNALKDVHSYFFCATAIGNDGTKNYSKICDADRIYGVGAYTLMADPVQAIPAGYSSVSEAVDFVMPGNIYLPNEYGYPMPQAGTSFADPFLLAVVSVVQSFFINVLGRPITEKMMYQFLRDCAKDMKEAGKDNKTGWGAPILPPPDSIDIRRYAGEMLSSRNIDDLRPDVAANCRKMIEIARADGWPILVTGTVRDREFQEYCYYKGTSKSKVPTFHSVEAGLAFDICKNIKGQEYSDNAFWDYCGALGKKMGFTWGGDWTSIVDKSHFQWDGNGTHTGTDILAGRYPPPMPLFEREEEMTQEQFEAMYDKINPTYATLEDVPDYWKGETKALIDSGKLKGTGEGKLNIRHETLRAVIIGER